MAKKLGLKKHDTWSCYRPKISKRGISPCEECDACKLHNLAWR
ncbi:MAG: 7-cyano-7-deazaguanine synthase [Betaproteobacteria bacterium]|nr:7-cyano-7-deazaguanine synthase [Betaproteobacteria bacterium]